ncbi:MAG: glycine--tRNA ligase subunit beta [Elusimicrobiota bacterium]
MSPKSLKQSLLEIGTESLPARFMRPALEQLKSKTEELLKENRLSFGRIEVFGTPMRLAVIISGIPEKSTAEELELTGPPARLLKDENGKYTKQAEGFARKHDLKPQDLGTKTLPKGEFLLVKKTNPGEAASKVMARVFPELIERLEFPKSMVWEEDRFRFARPIRTLCALFGRKTIVFKLAGVKSGFKVRGLAATGAKPVTILSPDHYVKVLRDRCVLVDPEERRRKLEKTLEASARRSGGFLDKDEALLDETVWLTEHPAAVLGHYDKAFLELPEALLLTVLKSQLRFFPIVKKDGHLVPDFIGVRDGLSEGQKDVQSGYERVLEARMNDARFFYDRDCRRTLEENAAKLDRVGFQKGLGTMKDKTERVVALVDWISERLLQDQEIDVAAAKTAAGLVYADLVSDVVGEFAELQGTMGGIYAHLGGADQKTALAIAEFHYPTAANAPLPAMREGAVVSLAGKLDTMAAMFSAGFIPTGSADPFALRRVGIGALRILLEKQLPLSLSDSLDKSFDTLAENLPSHKFEKADARRKLEDFLWQRLEALFIEKGYRIDEVRSVREGGLSHIAKTFQRLAAVHSVRSEPDFLPLAQAFKRASNILKQAKVGHEGEVDPELLKQDAESALFGALCKVEGEVRENVAHGRYEEGLRTMVRLKPSVDAFFDKVLVMDKDESVKNNRLSLLSRLVRLFKTVADISHIQN